MEQSYQEGATSVFSSYAYQYNAQLKRRYLLLNTPRGFSPLFFIGQRVDHVNEMFLMPPSTLAAPAAPAAAAIATSSQTPLPLSSLEPDSNVTKEQPRKLSQKVDAVPMVDTNGDVF